MLHNNADARRCSYFELGLPVSTRTEYVLMKHHLISLLSHFITFPLLFFVIRNFKGHSISLSRRAFFLSFLYTMRLNRPFPSSKKFHFQNEAKCETFVVEMSFICIIIKTHFHNKGFALSLVLKVKLFGTRKWPI